MDLNIVLVAPEIPQNTGAVGRLCVCLGATLHMIEPLGFSLDESHLKRAGLDYWKHLEFKVHETWENFLINENPKNLFFASTKGEKSYLEFNFQKGDSLVFGNETRGLPEKFYHDYTDKLFQIPMPGNFSRSHNLANAVAIISYEAYRQFQTTNI